MLQIGRIASASKTHTRQARAVYQRTLLKNPVSTSLRFPFACACTRCAMHSHLSPETVSRITDPGIGVCLKLAALFSCALGGLLVTIG
jgi:hypothetical protein